MQGPLLEAAMQWALVGVLLEISKENSDVDLLLKDFVASILMLLVLSKSDAIAAVDISQQYLKG